MRFNKNPLRQARNPNSQLPISEDKVRDIVKNLSIYQPSQELEATIRVVGVMTEGLVDNETFEEAIAETNQTIQDYQDSTDLRFDEVNDKVDSIELDSTSRALGIGTIATVLQPELLTRASLINVTGFYQKGDGGEGTFVYDASQSKSLHNGGTIIDPSHTAVPGSVEWYSAQGSGTGVWVRQYKGETKSAWFGARPDVNVNQYPALQSAINSTKSGEILQIESGRFYLDAGLTSSGKSITIRGNNTTLYQNSNIQMLTWDGSWSPIYGVSSIDITSKFSDGQANGISGTTINMTAVPSDWKSGDVIKLFADDVIPGSRPVSGEAKPRVGNFFVIFNVTSTSITVIGRPVDPMTLNIRVAKLLPLNFEISGVRFESRDMDNFTGGGLVVRSGYSPRIDVTFGAMPQICCSTRGCWAPKVTVVADRSNNDPANGRPGYAVHDAASEGGEYNVVASHCRHAYTDDNNAIAAGTAEVWRYGRPSNHRVSGIAKGTSATAFGTHSTAMNVLFDGCAAVDCQGAFSLRGYECKIFNGTSDRCSDSLLIFDEDRLNESSDSYNHIVDGFVVTYPADSLESSVIGVVGNVAAGTPQTNNRILKGSYLNNVTIIGAKQGILRAQNQTVHVGSIKAVGAEAMVNSSVAFRAINSEIIVESADLDYRFNTSGTGLILARDVAVSGAPSLSSKIEIKSGRVRLSSEVASRMAAMADGLATTIWDVYFDMDNRPSTTLVTQGAIGSRFDYISRATGQNRAYYSIADGSIETTMVPTVVSQTRNPVVFLRAQPTVADRTLTKFNPGAFQGQLLHIENNASSGNNRLIVPHGTTDFLFFNYDGRATNLSPGQSAQWMWNGTQWQQIQPVNKTILRRTVITQTTNTPMPAIQDAIVFISAGISTMPTAVQNTFRYTFKNISASDKTIASVNSETFNGVAGPYVLTPDTTVEFVSDGTGWRTV